MKYYTRSCVDFLTTICFPGEDLNDVGIIAADVNDSGAMLECCKKGDIILDCVGPVSIIGFGINLIGMK